TEAGVKNGVVQDKLYLPGLLKLKRLIDSGFCGKILSVRMEFGYWVFEGDWQEGQRPSWNYRKEDGGGMIVDMYPHWSYVIQHLFGKIDSVSCIASTHIPERVDEESQPYLCTADDAAYGTFVLENGDVVQANSSWAVRVNCDVLLTVHLGGTEGIAVAGLCECKLQHCVNSPKPVWNTDIPNLFDFQAHWQEVKDNQVINNAVKIQSDMFLKHVVADEAFALALFKGAEGI